MEDDFEQAFADELEILRDGCEGSSRARVTIVIIVSQCRQRDTSTTSFDPRQPRSSSRCKYLS